MAHPRDARIFNIHKLISVLCHINKLKKNKNKNKKKQSKTYDYLSRCRKSFDKIQYPL